jgi:glycosyltransferase involved in cell wall biosynthesis
VGVILKDKISVIVPVYNVENFIRKCIDSILNQTFTNLEIILVNDGSTDNSGKICEEYAKKDKRIIVIQQKNRGQSAARNAGLDIATGDYIGFVDSDDYIASNMYEILYNSLIENNCDLSIGRLQRSDCEEIIDNKTIKMSKYEALERSVISHVIDVEAYTRLYKRYIFNDLRFEIGKIYEDYLILSDVLLKAENIVYNGKAIYYYTIRTGSTTHPETIKVNEDILDATLKTLMAIKRENKLKPDIVWGGLRRGKDMLNYCSKNLMENKNRDFVKKSRVLYKSYYFYILGSTLLSFKEKVSITLFCYFYPLFKLIVNRGLS